MAGEVRMERLKRLLAVPGLAWLLLAALLSDPAWSCPGPTDPCLIDHGDYYALTPADWDGHRPLPAVLFFHGYGASAKDFVDDPSFVRAFADQGVLLVVPDSEGKGWRRRPPEEGRDELAFVDAMRDDLLRRFPIDRTRIAASGFSAGGALVLELACQRGPDYKGFIVLAGSFSRPVPGDCPGGPVNLLQIHGRADTAVPLAGLERDGRHMAPVSEGMASFRRQDGCAPAADRSEPGPSGQICELWDHCASGRQLGFCLHEGGHLMPEGWIGQAARWLDALPT